MYFETLTEKQKILLEEISQENPEQMKYDLCYLRDWLSKQPHMPSGISNEMLKCFLIGCKYSLEKTKQKLVSHFELKGEFPEFFANRDWNEDLKLKLRSTRKKILEKYLFPLPRLTSEGYAVGFGSLQGVCDDAFDFEITLKQMLMARDAIFEFAPFRNGDVILADMKNFSLRHLSKINLLVARNCLRVIENGYPDRVKKFILLSDSNAVVKLVNLTMPLLSKKIAQRVLVIKYDLQLLHKHLDKDILPEEYGGKEGSLQSLKAKWNRFLEDHRERLVQLGNMKNDERKRPIHSEKNHITFGSDGSFRKLNID